MALEGQTEILNVLVERFAFGTSDGAPGRLDYRYTAMILPFKLGCRFGQVRG